MSLLTKLKPHAPHLGLPFAVAVLCTLFFARNRLHIFEGVWQIKAFAEVATPLAIAACICLFAMDLAWNCHKWLLTRLLPFFLGFLGAGVYISWLTYIYWLGRDRNVDSEEVLTYLQEAAIVPALVLYWHLPLWAMRYLFGWRIACESEKTSPADVWHLRDLFLATSVVAVTLAASRASSIWQQPDVLFWAAGVAFLLPAITHIPAGWYGLRLEKPDDMVLAATVHFIVLLISVFGLVYWTFCLFEVPIRERPIYSQSYGMMLTALLFIGNGIAVTALRWSGYRLLRGNETE